jgi:hypothetical protein
MQQWVGLAIVFIAPPNHREVRGRVIGYAQKEKPRRRGNGERG